ncbi:hypothetical protein HDU98_006243 [Podochytrium sp. JEL0797]|nr:hypothetical protein HDU98_006243 [Podochytrium sp. JEL0797]
MADNRRLFTDATGSPLRFTVVRSNEREEIRQLIERHGGQVVEPNEHHIYMKLSRMDLARVAGNFYSSKFIRDSVRFNALPQDTEYYRLPAMDSGGIHNPNPPEIAPAAPAGVPRPAAPTRPAPSTAARGTRRPFSKEEDSILIDLLVKNRTHTSGNALYQALAAQYPTRTWQSWRDRAVKVLLPQFERNGMLAKLRAQHDADQGTPGAAASASQLGRVTSVNAGVASTPVVASGSGSGVGGSGSGSGDGGRGSVPQQRVVASPRSPVAVAHHPTQIQAQPQAHSPLQKPVQQRSSFSDPTERTVLRQNIVTQEVDDYEAYEEELAAPILQRPHHPSPPAPIQPRHKTAAKSRALYEFEGSDGDDFQGEDDLNLESPVLRIPRPEPTSFITQHNPTSPVFERPSARAPAAAASPRPSAFTPKPTVAPAARLPGITPVASGSAAATKQTPSSATSTVSQRNPVLSTFLKLNNLEDGFRVGAALEMDSQEGDGEEVVVGGSGRGKQDRKKAVKRRHSDVLAEVRKEQYRQNQAEALRVGGEGGGSAKKGKRGEEFVAVVVVDGGDGGEMVVEDEDVELARQLKARAAQVHKVDGSLSRDKGKGRAVDEEVAVQNGGSKRNLFVDESDDDEEPLSRPGKSGVAESEVGSEMELVEQEEEYAAANQSFDEFKAIYDTTQPMPWEYEVGRGDLSGEEDESVDDENDEPTEMEAQLMKETGEPFERVKRAMYMTTCFKKKAKFLLRANFDVTKVDDKVRPFIFLAEEDAVLDGVDEDLIEELRQTKGDNMLNYPALQSDLKSVKDKLAHTLRKLQDERIACQSIKFELRNTQKALAMEVGEEESRNLSKILEGKVSSTARGGSQTAGGGGWKGRAQQIQILKVGYITLEKELKSCKSKIHLLVEKTTTDDTLIQAMHAELETRKSQRVEQQQKEKEPVQLTTVYSK